MKKFKIFISSVLKELLNERLAIKETITESEVLSRYFDVEMWEEFPPMAVSSRRAYLEKLKGSDIYIGLFGNEYGVQEEDGLSPTEREYRTARDGDKHILIFLKGKTDEGRHEKLKQLLKEFRGHKGYSYKRFENYLELKNWVRKGLIYFLEKEHGIKLPTHKRSLSTLDKTTNNFDKREVLNASENDISLENAAVYFQAIGLKVKDETEIIEQLKKRNMLHYMSRKKILVPTVAGLLLFGKNPEVHLVQSKIKADSFQGINTIDQKDIKGTIFDMLRDAEAFCLKNMKTAVRIEGFSRVQIAEYPIEALREAVVNAIVHRDYAIGGSTVMIQVFSDRIEVASPGLLPDPLSLEMVRSFKYRPISRNPILARTLFELKLMEERGGGFKRMHEMTINYGLESPKFDYDSGYFVVTFYGPEDIFKVSSTKSNIIFEIPTNKLGQLIPRQKDIIKYLLENARITSNECTRKFKVTRDTANRDFKKLKELDLIEQRGTGRATYYVLKE